MLFPLLLVAVAFANEEGSSDFEARLAQANRLRAKGEFTEAEGMYRQLVQETRALGQPNARHAAALHGLASVLFDNDVAGPEVISMLEQSLSILEASYGTDDIGVAYGRYRLAACYRLAGRYREAEGLLAPAAAAIEAKFGPHHLQVATVLYERGALLNAIWRCGEAEKVFLRSLQIRQEILGKDDWLTGGTLASLGKVYCCLGRYAEAERTLRASLSVLEQRSTPALAAVLLSLGEVYYTLGSFDQAKSACLRAAAISEQFPQAIEVRVNSLSKLGELELIRRRPKNAEWFLKEAARLGEAKLARSNLRLANVFKSLGDVYASHSEFQPAEEAYRRSIQVIQSAEKPGNSEATVLVRLALLRQKQGRLDDALPLFERALEIDRKTIGPQHPYYGEHLTDYAAALRKMKRKNEAKELESLAREIRERNYVNMRTSSTVDVRELSRR